MFNEIFQFSRDFYKKSQVLSPGESTVSKDELVQIAQQIKSTIDSSNWVTESAQHKGEFLLPVLDKIIAGASLDASEKQGALQEYNQDFRVLFSPDITRRFNIALTYSV